MRLVLALGLIGALTASAVAGEVEDRQASVARIEGERRVLENTQRGLYATYQRKVAEVERWKKSRAWNAKTRREEAQADAQQVAKRLEAGQARIKNAEQRLAGERRALVQAIDRELAGQPNEARKGRLARLRDSEQQKIPVPVKKLRVPDERIDPLDDPEDLDEKAARLKKSEDELTAELLRVERRAAHLKSQAQMARSNSRSKDIFVDAQKGRRPGRTQAESAGDRSGGAGAANDGDGAPTAGGSSPPPTGPAESDGFTGSPATGGAATPEDPNPTVSPSGSAVDVVTQYSEVVDRSTIDALRSAERSSDPAVRAQAAEKLAAALRARTERVKQQRQAIERRAKQLRSH